MISNSQIQAIVSNIIGQGDMYIVEAIVNAGNKINIIIDSTKGVNIDDCVMISRAIEQQLDRETEDFELEVSSPGLTQPFKVPQQYQKNVGREVEILSKSGQKQNGKLLSVTGNTICLEIQKKIRPEGKKRPEWVTEQISLDINEIKSTKLIINF